MFNKQIIGCCSICGGEVTVPFDFWSIIPPVPTCENCGAVMNQEQELEVIPMRPAKKWSSKFWNYLASSKLE
ncbi:MAG: hypothetical protein AABY07_00915 [Nanoarchaeota archaeon]